MAYVKSYIKYNESVIDSNSLSGPAEFSKLKHKLSNTFKILGLSLDITISEDQYHTKYPLLSIKLDFYGKPYSLLYFLCQPIIGDDKRTDIRLYPHINGKADIKYEIIISDETVNISPNSVKPSDHRINPKDANEAYTDIINLTIDLFEKYNGVVNRKPEGTSLELEVKDLIISYLKSNLLLESPIHIPSDITKIIYDIISNMENPYRIIKELKTDNTLLYIKLSELNNKTNTASDMGEMGF